MNTEKTKIKKRFNGLVVSDAMDKTVVVKIENFKKHPKYKKYMKQSKRFKAHDEKNEYKVGTKVTIEECVPISKGKRFKVV